MGIQERLAKAKAELAAAHALLTASDIEDEKALAELARAEAEALELRERKRELLLSRAEVAAKDELGDEACIRGLLPVNYPDFFIIRRNGAAHDRWVRAMLSKKSAPDVALDYAVAVVYQWNDLKDFDGDNGVSLRLYLKNNPGIVTTLTDAAAELAGIYARERKRAD